MSIADFSRRPEPIPLDDFWFYDPERVREWAPAYYHSNYDTGHLPRPGVGMIHQHKTVQHDWRMWLRGLTWAQGEIEQQRELQRQSTMMGAGF